MADFIIKPTSGNLILKDDQNVARMTIAPTSGATTFSNLTLDASASFAAGVPYGYHFFTITSGTVNSTSSTVPTFFSTTSETTGSNNLTMVATDRLIVHFAGGRTGNSTSQRHMTVIRITDGTKTEDLRSASVAYGSSSMEVSNQGFVVSDVGYSGTVTVSAGGLSLDGSNACNWVGHTGATGGAGPPIWILMQKMKG